MGSGRYPRSWRSCKGDTTVWSTTRCSSSSLASSPSGTWRSAMDRPFGLLAELTYRCPLSCAYCSNPLNLADYGDELTTAEWQRVLAEAQELGVLQLHFSGGEPLLRRDLVDLAKTACELGMYTNLITSALGLN